LIEHIDLTNNVVSIDAIANSPAIAKQIKDKGGDYILSLKKNQKSVFEQVADYMKNHQSLCDVDKNTDYRIGGELGSGRIETRTCYVTQHLTLMEDVLAWQGIKSVIMIHAKREVKEVVEENFRFYLSSKDQNASYFNKTIRGHWGIENDLHWQLDLTFGEDSAKTRMGNGAENHNTLRKIALQILQQQNDKHSVKERRKKAGWNDKYLVKIIQNSFF
jgi:predicted transposase YbfD/YdcC